MDIDRDTKMLRKSKLDFKGLLIVVLAAGLVVQGLAWAKKETFGWDEMSNATLWAVLLIVAFNLYLTDHKRKSPPPPMPPQVPPPPGAPPL